MIQGFSHQTMALEEGIDSLFRFIGFRLAFYAARCVPTRGLFICMRPKHGIHPSIRMLIGVRLNSSK